MNNSLKYFTFSILLAIVASCSENSISQAVGALPDETSMNNVGGILYSERTLSRMITIGLYEGDGEGIEKINYVLTKPVATPVTLKAVVDETLVEAYNLENNSKLKAFPADNVHFENEGILTVASGEQTSSPVKMVVSTKGLEIGKPYLLALTVANTSANIDVKADKQRLYYRVYIHEKITTCEPSSGQLRDIPPLLPDLTSVFYVNTENYQPLIASAWGIMVDWDKEQLYSLGNIVNLKTATIDYDAVSQRALFKLGVDLSYVLEHRDKYIRTLQDYKRKVCLCIENGGKGVGFCNMTDIQIADFVRQVKEVIERYQLDGVNLWDDDNKYIKAGPEMNTSSYPKLIKALREALPDKLLTLVDKGEATEYFYDINKCGGIEVGRYIDYAWHGYFSPTEELQIINPNSEGSPQNYSKYTRRPIAGLDEKCYGSVNVVRYPKGAYDLTQLAGETIAQWKTEGNKKSDILVFGSDLIGNEYAENEGAVQVMFDECSILTFMDNGDGWDFSMDDYLFGDVFYQSTPLIYHVTVAVDNGFKKDW